MLNRVKASQVNCSISGQFDAQKYRVTHANGTISLDFVLGVLAAGGPLMNY